MAQRTWPDGEPRRSAADAATVGGLKDGRALRHADGTEPPAENFGWLDKTGAVTSNPQGAPYVRIGPGSAVRGRPAPKTYTTGDQRNRKR